MRRVHLTYAVTHLSKLLDIVQTGQEVVISRHGKDVARPSPVHQKTPKDPLPLKKLAEYRAAMLKLRTSSTKLLQQLRDERY